jgi:hypothetical protein
MDYVLVDGVLHV